MPLTRRCFLLTAATGALQASCSSIPEAKCVAHANAGPHAPQRLDIPLLPEVCELRSFDEITSVTPLVYTPKSKAELQEILRNVPAGRHVTFRGGGNSMDDQSLNTDIVVKMTAGAFSRIGTAQVDTDGFHFMRAGAGATWWNVLEQTSMFGLIPQSLVTADTATVGGTLSAGCWSRRSPITGKEGRQVRSFDIVLADGRALTCHRPSLVPDKTHDNWKLWNAVIGGFGYLGVVTSVDFDLTPTRSNFRTPALPPRVLTRSTRYGPTVDWDALLKSMHRKARANGKLFLEQKYGGQPKKTGLSPLSASPGWAAISIAAFFAGDGMSANLMEQRFVYDQPLRPVPGGVYQVEGTFPVTAERMLPWWPSAVEVAMAMGFPEGEFVDDLFGWAFFLGNSGRRAKTAELKAGNRLNLSQYSFVLPSGPDDDACSTGPTRRFLELIEARFHRADIRPADVDLLWIPADDFLLSPNRGLPGFAVTMQLADKNLKHVAQDVNEALCALSNDCRTLGGRVHLVKNVLADAADLVAMHGDAAAELRKLKEYFDPKDIFRNAFFKRVFNA